MVVVYLGMTRDIWNDRILQLDNRQAELGEGGALIVKGRHVLKHTKSEVYNTHTYTTYTQQFLHSHHASTGPRVKFFFFFFLSIPASHY